METGELGTDLWPQDCDEDQLDEKVDWSLGFVPTQPVYLATGDFFEENPEDEENYLEMGPDDVEWFDPDDCAEDDDDDDGTSSYYTDTSDNAQPICDINQVSWIEQADGDWLPWQWYEDPETQEWECYLAYVEETEGLEDEVEEQTLQQMADVYIAANKDLSLIHI